MSDVQYHFGPAPAPTARVLSPANQRAHGPTAETYNPAKQGLSLGWLVSRGVHSCWGVLESVEVDFAPISCVREDVSRPEPVSPAVSVGVVAATGQCHGLVARARAVNAHVYDRECHGQPLVGQVRAPNTRWTHPRVET
jgi:hypothetical protein